MVPLRFICHNVRHAEALAPGEAPWSERLPLLMAHLKYHTRWLDNAILCLQEPLHGQLNDIMVSLKATGQEWSYIGAGREDGKTAGEYSPIIYKSSFFEVVNWDTVWLSPKPMETGWDASTIRIMTIARMRHRSSGASFVVINAHFDDQGDVARREAAKMVVSESAKWSRGSQHASAEAPLPIIAMGDFNSTPDRDSYGILNQYLEDVKELCNPSDVYGEEITYTDFPITPECPPEILDHVFVGPRANGSGSRQWKVEGYAVIPHCFDATKILHSDHRAVVADLTLFQ